MQSVMSRLKEITGVKMPDKKLSEEEYVKFQCDSYNSFQGKQNEFDGYNCDKCKNRGYIANPRLIDGSWYELHSECTCMKARRAIIRLIRSGLKNVIRDKTFAKYDATDAWQATLKEKAIEFAKREESGAWFFIGGQSGSGKTHLCIAISAAYLKRGKGVQYMLWRDDVTKLKGSVTDSKAYDELITAYKTADVLYIDDLFKNGKDKENKVQPPTAADIQIAFEILNYRYNNKHLVTIITSERTLYELVDIDEATAGRISEMAFDKGYGFNIKEDRTKNYRLRKSMSDL